MKPTRLSAKPIHPIRHSGFRMPVGNGGWVELALVLLAGLFVVGVLYVWDLWDSKPAVGDAGARSPPGRSDHPWKP